MDSRCTAWAHLLIAAIKDATPQEAVGIAAGALGRAVECGRREAKQEICAWLDGPAPGPSLHSQKLARLIEGGAVRGGGDGSGS